MKKATSGVFALMKTPKNCGMRKAPNEAIADDQPMTAGAYVLSKMMPIWRKVEPLPTPVP